MEPYARRPWRPDLGGGFGLHTAKDRPVSTFQRAIDFMSDVYCPLPLASPKAPGGISALALGGIRKDVRDIPMTKDQAIAWAVSSLTEYAEYGYYDNQASADRAALAMSKLSKSPWHVVPFNNGFWLKQGKGEVSHKRNPRPMPQS